MGEAMELSEDCDDDDDDARRSSSSSCMHVNSLTTDRQTHSNHRLRLWTSASCQFCMWTARQTIGYAAVHGFSGPQKSDDMGSDRGQVILS